MMRFFDLYELIGIFRRNTNYSSFFNVLPIRQSEISVLGGDIRNFIWGTRGMRSFLYLSIIGLIVSGYSCNQSDFKGNNRINGSSRNNAQGTPGSGNNGVDSTEDMTGKAGSGGSGGSGAGGSGGSGSGGSGAAGSGGSEFKDNVGNPDGDGDSGNKDNTLVEDGGNLDIPGIKVQRVGVNFEDMPLNGDADFNDAVLCFTGDFKVEGTSVVSYKVQSIKIQTSSHAGCNHTVTVTVVNEDGTESAPLSFDSKSGSVLSLDFKIKSKLEVKMQSRSSKCNKDAVRSMHNAGECKVLPDVCNLTGG